MLELLGQCEGLIELTPWLFPTRGSTASMCSVRPHAPLHGSMHSSLPLLGARVGTHCPGRTHRRHHALSRPRHSVVPAVTGALVGDVDARGLGAHRAAVVAREHP